MLEISGISIRILGGAALRIASFDRATTSDIDAQIQSLDKILPLVEEIGRERGWPSDWLNDQAAMFIPRWGRTVEWEALLESFYPGDALEDRTIAVLGRNFEGADPPKPATPPRADLT